MTTIIKSITHCKDCQHSDHPWAELHLQGQPPLVSTSGAFKYSKDPSSLPRLNLHYYSLELSCGHVATLGCAGDYKPQLLQTFPCYACLGYVVTPKLIKAPQPAP